MIAEGLEVHMKSQRRKVGPARSAGENGEGMWGPCGGRAIRRADELHLALSPPIRRQVLHGNAREEKGEQVLMRVGEWGRGG